MITLLVILLHFLPEIGATLLFLLSWVYAGWKFSLSAAPAAYDERKELLERLKKTPGAFRNSEGKYMNPKNTSRYLIEPDERAYRTGKQCIKRGPFAYFLTPQWNNKLTVAWTPAEVTAQNLIVSTGETLNKVKELGEKTESALDLGDYSVSEMARKVEAYKNLSVKEYVELKNKAAKGDKITIDRGREKVVPDLKERPRLKDGMVTRLG